MDHREFTVGDIIVVKGMKEGESFDPKVLLIDPTSEPGLRCYIGGLLLDLILQTKPFTVVKEIRFLPIFIDNPNRLYWEDESRASLAEIEKKDFFGKRIGLSVEEFLWATFSLLSASDSPNADHPPLLNKNEFATYIIGEEFITMFQLVGSYAQKRGWLCATFFLSEINEEQKSAPMMNKILLPCG